MKRISGITALVLAASTLLWAKDPGPVSDYQAPRWGFLGDDKALKATIAESQQVLMVCVYSTELRNVKPPFAQVVFSATVVEALKGTHALGDRITLAFQTDSLPLEEKERVKFIESANSKNLGALKMVFLNQAKSKDYNAEWLYVPACEADMLAFARRAASRPKNPK